MAKGKILIVDDEKDFVEVFAERLEARGFEVTIAFNGKDCLEKARADRPDVIILDIMMPGMDGYDVCRKLKIDKESKGIPVIFLSAKFQPNDLEFGREMGAEAYLTKPCDMEDLLKKIKDLTTPDNAAKTGDAKPRKGRTA